MKRIKILNFCCVAVFLLTACGSSSSKNEEEKISVTGADGKEYTSYQEACRAEDFEAALKFVDKYEAQSMEFDEYDRYIQQNVSAYTSARDFVFNSEVQILFSNGSTEASDRVVYLLNSLPIKGKRPNPGGVDNVLLKHIVQFENMWSKIV